MKLLKELLDEYEQMKLASARLAKLRLYGLITEQSADSMHFEDLNLWLAQGSTSDLEAADVDVFFEYEAASHSDHPYGETTAREYHGSEVSITSVLLSKDTNRYDEEAGEVLGVLPKGTDLMKQPWWREKWTTWLEARVREAADQG